MLLGGPQNTIKSHLVFTALFCFAPFSVFFSRMSAPYCHQVGHLARKWKVCLQLGQQLLRRAATLRRRLRVGATKKGRSQGLTRALLALLKRLPSWGKLNSEMDNSMGRKTKGAGNHFSGCPAQNTSRAGEKELNATS
jgi:hypothetical protein